MNLGSAPIPCAQNNSSREQAALGQHSDTLMPAYWSRHSAGTWHPSMHDGTDLLAGPLSSSCRSRIRAMPGSIINLNWFLIKPCHVTVIAVTNPSLTKWE